jgi:hypothetical protein
MRITKGLVWLFLACGVFFGSAILANRLGYLPTAMQSGGKYELLFEAGIRIAATLIIGSPVVFFILSLFSAGAEKIQENGEKQMVMKLRGGARVTGTLLSLALSSLFFLVAYHAKNMVMSLLLAPFGLLFLVAVPWFLVAKVIFDRHEIYATDYLLRMKRQNWSDLTGIEYRPDAFEYHLTFERGGKLRISVFYAGVRRLIEFAQTKVRHARTS